MLGGTLLLYNLDRRTGGAIKVLCAKLRLQWREIDPADYDKPLGALLGLPARTEAPDASPALPFREPMLVMANLLRPQFDALLQGMRQQGIRIPLKAVLTPPHITWTSAQLREELQREHEAVRGKEK